MINLQKHNMWTFQ